MKKYLILLLIPLIVACSKSQNKKTEEPISPQENVIKTKAEVKKLPPLTNNELTLTEKDFGEVIELKGTSHPVDKIFQVKECEMIALDSMLIVKNQINTDMFMVFSLPDFKFIKSFGRFGRGPCEFQYPSLVKDESGEFLCYIYEKVTNKLFSLDKNLVVSELSVPLRRGRKSYNDKQLYGLAANDFLYVESIRRGKAVFRVNSEKDSTTTTMLKTLAFSEKHKNWAAYIGDFGVNGKNKRSVFAYKYFKRLIFLDYKNMVSRVVSFDMPSKTKRGNPLSMMAPSNTTHYWGMSSNDKYVYVLYSGRSPIQVSKELNKSSGYIYVEQFDWNGNPIKKYKLDHWGYFCVNKKENRIYLASNTDEHPFVSYQLPVE
jgi:hypothetical protein